MFRRTLLQLTFLCLAGAVSAQVLPPDPAPPSGDFAPDQPPTIMRKIPAGVILVKGAEPTASDHATPLPEEGAVLKDVYKNSYFGLSYPLPDGWEESFKGPPPSDHGGYVLANILPGKGYKGPTKGTILFTAQDIFFGRKSFENAKALIADRQEHLEPYYDVEHPSSEVTIAGRKFARFDYESKAAGLHWTLLATQIRCHAVQFVLTSRDPELIASLVKDMERMTLPEEAGATAGNGGGDWPVCVANYARAENLVERVEPDLKDRRFNDIPVRLIIDKKGRVRHVHVLSAFPEQSKAIIDALMQWKFKPYLRDGNPVEVETGIMFGGASQHHSPAGAVTASRSSE